MTKAYRYEDHLYGSGDGSFEDPYRSFVRVELSEYEVVKETPKGYWVAYDSFSGTPRHFVRRDARKHFALLTKEEALESFKKRKERQIRLLKSRLDRAEQALSQAQRIDVVQGVA